MRKLLPSLVLAVLSLAGASCQKNADPVPYVAPVATYEMYSSVSYPTSRESGGISHSPKDLLGRAAWENGRITLYLSSGNLPVNQVRFMMPSSFPGKLGAFVSESAQAPVVDEVQTTYTLSYDLTPTTRLSRIHRGRDCTTEGSVVITAYDGSRNLISGSYEITFKNVADPYAGLLPNLPVRNSVVVVGGEFTNLPIKP
ncbi:hypothetical protein [Hymenobacter terrestris]|uniref:Uncharacterized protein n=1 Tax=Hymenobacter terrestris TaxID=2748310 RepID=A0ABX2Q070_9BACT|nr:hypothetical protein [Hymenobacter terrestris]NVO83446.1 hypothetical protein [Hymenobacter terrestris]